MSPSATVVITTKNRKEDLRVAVASALAQSVPVDVLVIDDGSTDGTAEMVRDEFPRARVHREEPSRGYIVRRNQAARLAGGSVVVSIDDDAAFPSPRTVEQTLLEFDHPRVGAVAVPFINVNQSPTVHQRSPGAAPSIYVTDSFVGTAHALRRDVFLALGGYREELFHQGEENDYCLRMLNAGYVTRLGRADPIHHFESPRRDRKRIFVHAARNHILYAWQNVPMPYTPAFMAGTSVKLCAFGVRRRHPLWVVEGLARGYARALGMWGGRAPVSRAVYRMSRRLRHDGPLRLEKVEPLLPSMKETL